ncbi:unnamed protein product [Natator depressus]
MGGCFLEDRRNPFYLQKQDGQAKEDRRAAWSKDLAQTTDAQNKLFSHSNSTAHISPSDGRDSTSQVLLRVAPHATTLQLDCTQCQSENDFSQVPNTALLSSSLDTAINL